MTAKEARAIITSKSRSLIQSCEERILEVVYKNETFLKFPLAENLESIHKRNLLYHLKDNGFEAEVYDTFGKNQKSGEYILISWGLRT